MPRWCAVAHPTVLVPSALRREVVGDGLGHRLGNPVHGLQVRQPRPRHGLGRPEVLQEGAFPCGSDAGDVVEGGQAHGLRPFGAVGADGPAVGLIAQVLDEGMERWRAKSLGLASGLRPTGSGRDMVAWTSGATKLHLRRGDLVQYESYGVSEGPTLRGCVRVRRSG